MASNHDIMLYIVYTCRYVITIIVTAVMIIGISEILWISAAEDEGVCGVGDVSDVGCVSAA